MNTKNSETTKEIVLDFEEQVIENALPDTWEALPFSKDEATELKLAQQAAAHYLRKDKQINIRLSSHDVEGLKRIATREGLRYQTLVSSVLHKFVSHYLSSEIESP